MMLENCCYGREELMTLKLVREGLFGEVDHCNGGYHHNLLECGELLSHLQNPKEEHPHYRIDSYIHRNCEQYPTHELGPISKILNINRGNRMLTLSSFASKSVWLRQAAEDILGKDSPYANMKYAQGDIITTVIKCANGETIHLCLDTTLPRPYYSRNFTVRGTKGMYTEETNSLVVEKNLPKNIEEYRNPPHVKGNADEYREEFDSPIWKEQLSEGAQKGHGGIDWHVLNAFVEAIRDNRPSPIDVYDAAAWMSISALTEASLAQGGKLVEIPDFTGGKWVKRPRLDVCEM
jgi:hypothetical protein